MTESNYTPLITKKLSMPLHAQYQQGTCDNMHSFFPHQTADQTQKQNRTTASFGQMVNVKHPFGAVDFPSICRSMPCDFSLSTNSSHVDPVASSSTHQRMPSTAVHHTEDPTVLKINIPIEMIIRTMPQQSSPMVPCQEQWNNRCQSSNPSCSASPVPCQTRSDWGSKPGTSLIKKAQEVFFGTSMNHDRGDLTTNSVGRLDMPSSHTRIGSEISPSTGCQQKPIQTAQRTSQGLSHPTMNSPCLGASALSYPRRCECGSNVYPSL